MIKRVFECDLRAFDFGLDDPPFDVSDFEAIKVTSKEIGEVVREISSPNLDWRSLLANKVDSIA